MGRIRSYYESDLYLIDLAYSNGILDKKTYALLQENFYEERDRKMNEVDLVNHPPHYTKHPSGIECIEITRHMGFNLGNAVKYIWRADLKGDSIQDLEKAIWYIQDEIKKRSS